MQKKKEKMPSYLTPYLIDEETEVHEVKGFDYDHSGHWQNYDLGVEISQFIIQRLFYPDHIAHI